MDSFKLLPIRPEADTENEDIFEYTANCTERRWKVHTFKHKHDGLKIEMLDQWNAEKLLTRRRRWGEWARGSERRFFFVSRRLLARIKNLEWKSHLIYVRISLFKTLLRWKQSSDWKHSHYRNWNWKEYLHNNENEAERWKHGELIENKPTFIQQTRKHKQHKHLECSNNAVLCARELASSYRITACLYIIQQKRVRHTWWKLGFLPSKLWLIVLYVALENRESMFRVY